MVVGYLPPCCTSDVTSPDGPLPFQFVGRPEGASKVWLGDMALPQGFTVGLHKHGGDEIFRVLSGVVRLHVDGTNTDIESGRTVVIPPRTEHGFRILTPDTHMICAGEIEMGEWVTVIDPDGSRREVEVQSRMMPWHRSPADGGGTDLPGMMALFATTAGVFDQDPGA
jgi:quercetin dioxygenase-like cupin family protein